MVGEGGTRDHSQSLVLHWQGGHLRLTCSDDLPLASLLESPDILEVSVPLLGLLP
jgi:hypothetical protein